MSSYELLELIEFLPDEGAFKTAVRGGAWTEDQLIAAETFNEIARLRASYHAVNGGKDGTYEPFAFEDPLARRRKEQAKAAEEKLRTDARHDLFDSLGWT